MSASDSLRGRVPGQSVMSEIVARHRARPARSSVARLFGFSPLAAGDRALYRAALGELVVGDTLDNLGPEWDVLHVVPVSGVEPEIDHLVIGPAGVFTIRTRNFPGQEIWVAGNALLVGAEQSTDIVDARIEGERASAMLSRAAGKTIAVLPIVVLVKPKKLVVREWPVGVEVISSKVLAGWLRSRERTQDGAEVALVSDVADRSTTWHVAETHADTDIAADTDTHADIVNDTHTVDIHAATLVGTDLARTPGVIDATTDSDTMTDTQELHRHFAVLREDVVRAASLRVFWGGIAFIVAAGFLWLSVASFVSHVIVH
jgi:hypothetical protein